MSAENFTVAKLMSRLAEFDPNAAIVLRTTGECQIGECGVNDVERLSPGLVALFSTDLGTEVDAIDCRRDEAESGQEEAEEERDSAKKEAAEAKIAQRDLEGDLSFLRERICDLTAKLEAYEATK